MWYFIMWYLIKGKFLAFFCSKNIPIILFYSKSTEIVKKQLDNENYDVISGNPFDKDDNKLELSFRDLVDVDKNKINEAFNIKIDEKALKQGRDKEKSLKILGSLANGISLEEKYHDHSLKDNKYFKNCRECHITPDWLLVYKYVEDELIFY